MSPEEIEQVISWKRNIWYRLPGTHDMDSFGNEAAAQAGNGGPAFRPSRWYAGDDELVHTDGGTYALTTQWGGRTGEALRLLIERWPDAGVEVRKSEDA